MQKISWAVFSEIQVSLKHKLLETTARLKGFLSSADFNDESTESNKTFYLVTLMLFVSLIFLAPDKIPQTLAASDFNPGLLEKIQEIAKKALPFIG